MAAKDGLGRYGEQIAVRHLVGSGLDVLDRNWRCDEGELDVVANDGGVLVFCEVKTRSGVAFGDPVEAIPQVKAERLRRLAMRWITAHDRAPSPVRFDVVAVLRGRSGPARVRHLRGVL